MKKISVVIPSKNRSIRSQCLFRAIGSAAFQRLIPGFRFEILVGVDVDDDLNFETFSNSQLELRVKKSNGKSQAKALNAALKAVSGDYVCFLEDDDYWDPFFCRNAIGISQSFDFVSSTQSEYDLSGNFLRINDFPTPSGWFMRREILAKVGLFDESLTYHIDNDFLGRVNRLNLSRAHLVETTAPSNPSYMPNIRPWLANIHRCSPNTSFHRHESPWPLINRTVHDESGMSMISNSDESKEKSKREIELLIERYGKIPW